MYLYVIQVQYVYLHRAILQALTFDCKSIPAENFITYYSQLIKKDGVSSQMETQFKVKIIGRYFISFDPKAGFHRFIFD